ncbi:hypothetical protein F511_34635 [Dorcoceras hygrometricum]|uniref:Uncharacterized protein n=1 Tax=Dorcoceras hygrometricum TaxID=472368 RepID=A0A2Z7ATS2_9LAMI|nr:hypothetical protein F511_34635 [Dorcoceras hygrometricum]
MADGPEDHGSMVVPPADWLYDVVVLVINADQARRVCEIWFQLREQCDIILTYEQEPRYEVVWRATSYWFLLNRGEYQLMTRYDVVGLMNRNLDTKFVWYTRAELRWGMSSGSWLTKRNATVKKNR